MGNVFLLPLPPLSKSGQPILHVDLLRIHSKSLKLILDGFPPL
jgi:hypothetical protein